MKIIDNNNGSLKINGKTLTGGATSDIPSINNFHIFQSNRTQIITAGSTSTINIQDSTFLSSVSSSIFSYNDVQAIVPLPSAIGAITYSSSNTAVATISSNGVITAISAGSTVITIIVCMLSVQKVTVTVTQSGGVTHNTFITYISGSLGLSLNTTINTLLSGLTSPTFDFSVGPPYPWNSLINIYNVDGSRNTSGWWGTIDLTCIPTCYFNGVLVTPRDVIFAHHFGPWPGQGTTATFHDNNGNSYVRGFSAFTQLTGLSNSDAENIESQDIWVITLDSDLPDSITPTKIMPANFRNYLPQVTGGYPVVFTNQDHTLLIGQLYQLNSQITPYVQTIYRGDYSDNNWFYITRNLDSGSPVFMNIDGELSLLTDLHYVGGGPVISDNISQINAAIASNAASLSLSPYTVTTTDLSGFNSY